MEVEKKLPTKRKVQAWWRLGLRAPLVAGRNYSLIKYIFFLTLDRTIGSRFDKWGGRQFYTKYDLLAKDFFRLACVSIETHNLQRVFRPGAGVVPYIGYMGMCGTKGYGFQPFWSETGYQFRPFWYEIGCGLCTLDLNWICFLEELAGSSSFGDKTISLLMFTPTTVYVPWQLVTRSGHAPGSRASGLK